METCCPNPDCNHQFELAGLEADKRKHFLTECPQCGIKAAFRTLDALESIKIAYDKKVKSGAVSGGPPWDADRIPQLSVIVEDVRSLWNVGSIFRTSDGSGFEKIFLTGITGTPPRREIEKVSLGAEESVSWQYEINPLVAVKSLKEKGVEILGLEVSQSSLLLNEALKENSFKKPLCLVIGNEVSGVSPQLLSFCSNVCHLPMRGMKESLNVAVAFGIAAYAIADALN